MSLQALHGGCTLEQRTGCPTAFKAIVVTLRFLVLVFVAILLLEPLLTSLNKIKYEPIIPLLVDESESLVIQRDSNYVKTELPAKLSTLQQAIKGKERSAPLYGFSNELRETNGPDSLTFDKIGTNIGAALSATKENFRNQNLGAVILVSDGISNTGPNPLYSIEGLNAPVFTILVGDTSRQKDIRIEGVIHNEIAYLGDETPMKVKLFASGIKKRTVNVTLNHKGKTIGNQQVNLQEGINQQELTFFITPEEVGRQAYTFHVTEVDGEISVRNNAKTVFVRVMETKVKIALFAGGPHPDIGAIRMALARDERYELTEYIHKNKSELYQSPSQSELAGFDLFILHNFPFNRSDADEVAAIQQAIEKQNKPVLFFFGLFTDLSTAKPLYEHLAIAPAKISRGQDEFLPQFKSEYAQHSSFTFDESWFRLMNNGGPLYRNNSEWAAKGDAKVFATARIKNIILDYPFYGIRNHLEKKSVVFVGENIWRMRSHAMIESESFSPFDTWLYNNIQWLTVKEDKRKFKVRPVKEIFSGNEKVIFKGEAYDDSYNPLNDVLIKLQVKDEKGKTQEHDVRGIGNGQYYLDLPNMEQGTYQYFATGELEGKRIGTDQGTFVIGRSNIEHADLQANSGLLEQLSLRTGGKFYYAKDIDQVSKDILAMETLRPIVDYRKEKSGIEKLWWIFLILLGLLTTEWIIRKVHSLL